MVAILHDLNLAMRFADRIVLLHHGRLAAIGDRRTTITSERIRELFEVDVAIRHTDDGIPYLLPQTMQPVTATAR